MLTRAFLLTWYMAMMPRLEHAGVVIQQGFQKSEHSPVTDADMASRTILTDGWTQTAIVSEETFTQARASESLVTWVHPLDATQEYTKGLTQYVSVMACLTENGHPKAGIVHFPFRNETWAVIDGEWLERPAMFFAPPDTVVVSRSHTGDVRSAVTGYQVQPAGGSGYKVTEVLKGNALAYVHTTSIKTWDICAADAMMRAANGTFVQWATGKPFVYTTHVHENGVFAATTTSKTWFTMTMTMRSPWTQLLLVLVIWVGIYMYPDGPLSPNTSTNTQPIAFALCATALVAAYTTWGIAQERIMSLDYDGQRFQWPAVLIFLNRFVASMFAGYFVSKQTTPVFSVSVASLTNVVSSLCQYTALQSTMFPVVVVFKSLKMFPVLLIGRCVFKKRYNYKAYAIASGLAVGAAMCLVSSTKTAAGKTTTLGMLLMLGYVCSDALTSQWQAHLFRTYQTPPLEMMYAINTCSLVFTGAMIFVTGQLDSAITFTIQHPIFLVHLTALCVPGVIGQWFIYKTIEQHGAAAFALIMTSRQAFSLTASCVLFGHQFDSVGVAGFCIVTGVLFVKARVSIVDKAEYAKVAQTDPEEQGFDVEKYDYEAGPDHQD